MKHSVFEDMNHASRELLLDVVAEMLDKYLLDAGENKDDDKSSFLTSVRDAWVDRVKEAVEKVRWDPEELEKAKKIELTSRRFDYLLAALRKEDRLQLKPKLLTAESRILENRFSEVHRATVVAGGSRRPFAQAAAEQFVQSLRSIKGTQLSIGLVSGSTVADVIEAVEKAKNWDISFGVDPESLPERIRVFALNACLTEPQHLKANATILAYRLANAIDSQRRKSRVAVEAYGLSAPLLAYRTNLSEIDTQPQVKDVVKYTNPYRLDPTKNEKAKTELDVILTSVGEKPQRDQEGSIFYQLAEKFDKHESGIRWDDIVGDIIYTPVDSRGKPVALKVINKDQQEVDMLFYSAVDLDVLEGMAKDHNKKVVLVARYSAGKDKSPAIKAAVGGEKRYASVLVVDEPTFENLK